jgi:hypothetical protein
MQPTNFAKNDTGIALVTALVMTLISLTIVMAVMYMITMSITRTGGMKMYHTALEASYGGTDMVIKDIVPELLKNYIDFDTGALLSVADFKDKTEEVFSSISFSMDASDCIQDKLTKKKADWAACSSSLSDLRTTRDFSFTLPAAAGQPFTVYAKIVDTIGGNTDTSGLQLEGAGVAESTSVLTPQHLPYVYRVEVLGERSQNAVERANLTVLYAY